MIRKGEEICIFYDEDPSETNRFDHVSDLAKMNIIQKLPIWNIILIPYAVVCTKFW